MDDLLGITTALVVCASLLGELFGPSKGVRGKKESDKRK